MLSYLGVWSLGLFSPTFFSTSSKKKKKNMWGINVLSGPWDSPLAGWPQTWKTQGIWKIVKISGKTQGNLNFYRKNLETHGK